MNLQAIYFAVGVVGFALAAFCAIVAVVLFVRGDIRGVLGELSGKARQTELAEFSAPKRSGSARRNILTQDDGWKGVVSKGDLLSAGSSTGTGESSASEAESGSDWSFSEQDDRGVNAGSSGLSGDDAPTEVDSSRQSSADAAPSAQPPANAPAGAGDAAFAVVRAVVNAHSPHVVDESGVEVAYESPAVELGGSGR